MKKSQIRKGGFYSDGKQGLREVIAEGSEFKLYDGVEDDDCLRYRCLNAKSPLDIGHEGNSTRVSFAAWAKEEIPADEVDAFLLGLKADHVVGKLSEPQRSFLKDFDSDLTLGDSVECGRREYRMAMVCREKGLIAEIPNKLSAEERYFEVKFSPLGLAVLARVLGSE